MATIDIGRREGVAVPLLRAGELGPRVKPFGLGWGLHPFQVASSSIQPFGHNRHGPKSGRLYPFRGGELGPHLTQCHLGQESRDLSPYQVASWSIQPFGQIDMVRKLGAAVPPLLIFVTFDRYLLYRWYKLTFETFYMHESATFLILNFPR